jgi:hypothetical protein
MIKPRRIEHLQSEEPFSSDPYFNMSGDSGLLAGAAGHNTMLARQRCKQMFPTLPLTLFGY